MEKKKRFIVSVIYYSLIGAIIYLVFKYAVFLVMPFVVGFGAASLLNPAVRWLCSRFRMKRRPAALFALVIFYIIIGTLLSIIVVRASVGIGELSGRLPSLYENSIEPMITSGLDTIRELLYELNGSGDSLSEGIVSLFEYFKDSIGSMVSDFSVRLLGGISSFAASVPKVMVGILFSVISSFFFIIDYEKIISFAKDKLPSRIIEILSGIRTLFFTTVLKYLRSYTLILLITFSELFFGLSLVGIKNALLLAIIISLLDLLPIIGTGVVLIPWAVLEIINSNLKIGVGLLIIWLTVTVIRNIVEPKIVGRQVGLNPLVTLIAMFVGAKLFGFLGLLLAPVSLAVAVSFYGERNSK